MPQGRRKVPFSGKAKKEQLKTKKQGIKPNQSGSSKHRPLLKQHSSDDESSEQGQVQKLNHQPNKSGRNTNRYALQFYKESNEEVARRKELAMASLQKVPEEKMEIDVDYFFPKELDYPCRPEWSYDMSKEELDAKENKYFMDYVRKLQENFSQDELSFFELNLETWRQLWRVLEMSDIVLVIADIRFPALMFPSSLYEYVTKVLKKQIILVLNKIDLAPTPLVVAWKNYFMDKYENLSVLLFTTLPAYNLMGKQTDKAGLQIRRRKGRIRMAAEGTKLLLDTCKAIVNKQVDLTSWEEKIKEESMADFTDDDRVEVGEMIETKKVETGYYKHESFKDGILTIGCIGQPNVGKSSIMNAIMGKKVVSVSRTPGHTKHFQTIFLTQNVRLCDCPGLVFPSKVPKELQVLMGSFPIAQLREPYTSVKYLAERLDLHKLLRIEHPDGDDTWSAMDICEGWARKRGYLTAKAARLDSYRAANNMLRMALDGKICLNLAPPNYFANIDQWSKHPDISMVKWVKAISEECTGDEAAKITQQQSESDQDSDDDNDADQSADESPIECNSNKFQALIND